MRNIYLSLCIIVTSFFSALGQNNLMPLSGISPASPNAESFAKYGDIPVNKYNGIPNIVVSIDEISSRDLSIPISLSYHAGGIKVEEEASWVGLGWNLDVGGAITQRIRGNDDLLGYSGYGQNPGGTVLPDFINNGISGIEGMYAVSKYYWGFGTCFPREDWYAEGWLCEGNTETTFPIINSNGTPYDFSSYLSQMSDNIYDWQPDIFNFNFLNTSGKFVFDENGVPRVLDGQNIIFTKGDNSGVTTNNEGFTAVLDNGFIAYFGKKEETSVKNTSIIISRTFYLSHIKSPMGEIAYFTYVQNGSAVEKIWNTSQSQDLIGPEWLIQSNLTTNYSETTYNPIYLSEIHFSDSNKQIFFETENRIDINGGKKLTSIKINGEQEEQLKQFDFSYSYFQGDPSYEYSFAGNFTEDINSKRLKLNSVKERNGNDEKPPHIFSYDETVAMPYKTSYAQDYWGYFNGAENTQLIPDFRNFFPQQSFSLLYSYDGANRDPNPEYSKAGSLKRITYPTGGFSEFDFEVNDYSNFNSFSLLNDKKLIDTENVRATDVNDTNANQQYASFEVNFAMNVTFEILTTCPGSSQCGLYNPDQPELNSFTALYKNYPSSLNVIQRWPQNDVQANSNGSYEVTIFLEPGIYWMEAFYPDGMPNLGQNGFAGGVSISTKVPIYETVSKKYAGGLRIKKTRVSDGINFEKDIITNYKYTFENTDGEEESYGSIMSPPTFYRHTDRFYQFYPGAGPHPVISQPLGTRVTLSSQSFILESLSGQGSNIGYRKVLVTYGEEGSIGSSEFNYHNSPDVIYVAQGRPASLPSLGDSRNGLLLSQIDYDNQNNPVRTVVNDYTLMNEQFIKGIILEFTPSSNLGNCFHRVFYWYTERSARYELTNTKQTIDGLTIITDYKYNENHRSPVEITKYLESDPTQIMVTSIKYPHDLLSETSGWENTAILRLIDKNMITIPLETNISGMINSGSKTKYKCFPTFFDDQMPLPYKTYTKKGSNAFDLDGTFLEYNERGNVTKYLEDGYPVDEFQSFEWDNDLLTSKEFEGFEQLYFYYENSQQLKSEVNLDKTSTFYDYDDLQRLKTIKTFGINTTGSVLKTTSNIDYQLGIGNNSITNTIIFDDAPDQTTIQIFDGLGRLTSSTLNNRSTESYIFDQYGRVAQKQYLPGSYSTLEYENSPLGRMVKEIFPDGSDFEMAYGSAENYFQVSSTDENDNTSFTLTDMRGRTIKSIDALGNVTEFQFDEYGNTKAVLPPNYIETQERYYYNYDVHNRLTSKEIPSGGIHQFVYNNKNQLVASRTGNEWIGTKYDSYGRPMETGKLSGTPLDPENISFDEVYTMTEYDKYDNLNNITGLADYQIPDGNMITVKGKVVGTKVRILGTDDWVYTTAIYDDFGRAFKTNSSNVLNGNDLIVSDLNLADLSLNITRTHNTSINNQPNSREIIESYTYDEFLRTVTHHHSLDGATAELLSFSSYNGLDQLTSKKLGQAPGISGFLQNVDFKYNTRGWLTNINEVSLTGQDLSIPVCNDGNPTPPCGEKCDFTVEFSLSENDAIVDIVYGELDPLTNTYNSMSANLSYPYIPSANNALTNLENDLIAWMFAEGIANQGVAISFENGVYSLTISQTDAKFQNITTAIGRKTTRFINSCNPSSTQICDYSVDLTVFEIDQISQIIFNDVTANLNYPYNLNSNDIDVLVSDLEQWLQTENIINSGVSVTFVNQIFNITIYQTDKVFQSVSTNVLGTIPFVASNCDELKDKNEDICVRCIKDGYECDRCPYTDYTEETDKCTQCVAMGHDECESCPLVAKLIRPTKIKVEYNHPALSSVTAASAHLLRVTEQSFRTLHNDQVVATHKTLNTVVGEGTVSTTPLTHVMEIELGDQWINNVTFSTVKGNIQSMLIDQLESAGISEPQLQLAFAEAVIEVAASDWGETSGLLDDGAGGQTPTPNSLPINNPDMFSLQLTYADGHAMVNSPIQKNGNIAGMIWQTPGRNTQSYSFEYDEINRLTNAYHQDIVSGGQLSTDNKYGVEITYDPAGNIKTLNRRGVIDICSTPTPAFEYGAMDALSYHYTKTDGSKTNQLQGVEEFGNVDHGYKTEGGKYQYDGFGNMTYDPKSGANIQYNYLNLPQLITFDNGGSIQFVYDAAGIKLKKIVSDPDGYTLDYVGGIEYRNDVIESIHHAEGRITFEKNVDTGVEEPIYEYHLKDHLGNVRVTIADKDGDGYLEPFNVNPNQQTTTGAIDLTNTEVSQESHYYPFGMTMEGEWQNILNDSENNYLFNGTERNNEFNLGVNTTSFRTYDPAIGRWWQVDPLAEQGTNLSPYNFGFNNPIGFSDPNGDWPKWSKIKRKFTRFFRKIKSGITWLFTGGRVTNLSSNQTLIKTGNPKFRYNNRGWVRFFKKPGKIILIPAHKTKRERRTYFITTILPETDRHPLRFGTTRSGNVIGLPDTPRGVFGANSDPRDLALGYGKLRVAPFPFFRWGGFPQSFLYNLGLRVKVEGREGNVWRNMKSFGRRYKTYNLFRLTVSTKSSGLWAIKVTIKTKVRRYYFDNGNSNPNDDNRRGWLKRKWYGTSY